MTSTPRKPKRFLTAEQKYDSWVRMLTGQISQADAAAEAGVDRSVISRLRAVARDGAIAALQASKPGKPSRSRQEVAEAAALRAEVDRLQRTVVEQAVELAVLRGKSHLGMSGPIPTRVDGAAKATLLNIIDDAVDAGWSLSLVCAVLELDRGRVWRWQQRQRQLGPFQRAPTDA